MPHSISFQIFVASIALLSTLVIAIRFPIVFVSMFLSYQLFKGSVRPVLPELGASYTIDVTVGVLALLGAVVHRHRFCRFPFWSMVTKALVAIYCLFIAIMLITYPLSLAPNQGLKKILIFGVMMPFCIFIPTTYIQRPYDARVILIWIWVWGSITAIVTLLWGSNFSAPNGAVRMSFGYANPLLIMNIVANAAVVAIGGLILGKRYFLTLPIYLVAFIYTGTRGPILILSVILIYMIYVIRLKRTWIIVVFVPLVAAGVLGLTSIVNTSAGGQRFERILSGISGRLNLIYHIENNMSVSNWVFGSGIGSTAFMIMGRDEWMYPHNSIVEVAAELGIVGFILIFILFMWVSYDALQLRRDLQGRMTESGWLICYAALAIYAIINSLKTSSFFVAFDLWYFSAALLICKERFMAYRSRTIA